MSKYSEFIKSQKEKDMTLFFNGGYKMRSNQYFEFKRVISNDEIIIVTNNVQYFKNKDQFVLVVDNNKVVYLKNWQLRHVKCWDLGQNAYVVKLNRKYFKAYQLPFEFEEMFFEKEETFDDLLKVAEDQDKTNIRWALGQL